MPLDFQPRQEPPRPEVGVGVRSGHAMTVLGPVPVGEMGITLMHEHILIDGQKSWKCPCHPDERAIAEAPAHMGIIGELRMNLYMNRDNVSLTDADLAMSELKLFQALGGTRWWTPPISASAEIPKSWRASPA